MTDQSRHVRYSQNRLPHDKRVLPIYGEFEDDGRYYECWNCGFTCDIERDSIDTGKFGGSGVTVLDFPETNPDLLGRSDEEKIVNIEDRHVCLKNGPDGNPITVYRTNHYPDVSAGCPLCGCKNYR